MATTIFKVEYAKHPLLSPPPPLLKKKFFFDISGYTKNYTMHRFFKIHLETSSPPPFIIKEMFSMMFIIDWKLFIPCCLGSLKLTPYTINPLFLHSKAIMQA